MLNYSTQIHFLAFPALWPPLLTVRFSAVHCANPIGLAGRPE